MALAAALIRRETLTPKRIRLDGPSTLRLVRLPPDPNAIVIRRLKRSLDDKGVRLRISDGVQAGAAGEWDPNQGEIRIRPSALQSGLPALAQMLAHEATHVAQSCHAGGLRKEGVPLGIDVSPVQTFAQQLNDKLYAGHPATRTVELEAYTAGAQPDFAVTLLEHYCRR